MPSIATELVERLENKLKGRIIRPEDPAYDELRKIWNAMIDRRPALIVQCADPADIPPSIAFARENGLEISVRGAGHNIAGNALCEGGMLIDLSEMTKVRVDPDQRRASVEPGATLGDFDQAVQEHGLATPVGINSTTGISGLTLGGGFGWLTRKYGMTVDNLVSAEMITADGQKRTVSEASHPDLFWAIRGGGGNFGVVTNWEFQLHPVGPEILAGLLVFPLGQAKTVLTRYRQFAESAPLELNVWSVLRKAPPLPFLPEEVHGQEVIILALFYAGDIAKGMELIAPLRDFGDLHGEHVGPQPYVQWQQAFDPLLTPGSRNYWKSHNFTELSDGALDTVVNYAGKLPTPQTEIFIGLISGAANRIAADATAWAHRDTRFILNVHGRWEDSSDDERCIAWAREFFDASTPYASKGAYVNFMTEDESDRIKAAYGPNYSRLVEVKRKYDPENVFHLNQNIKP